MPRRIIAATIARQALTRPPDRRKDSIFRKQLLDPGAQGLFAFRPFPIQLTQPPEPYVATFVDQIDGRRGLIRSRVAAGFWRSCLAGAAAGFLQQLLDLQPLIAG